MEKHFFLALALLTAIVGRAQLKVQDKGILFLEGGAVLTVQGDVDSKADIVGTGTVLLKGMSLQQINMNGHSVFTLQLDNAANASLGGDIHIGSGLDLSGGRISLNAANLFLGSGACVTGYDKDHFVITNGPGMLVREGLAAGGALFPVGSNDGMYRPVHLMQAGPGNDVGVRAIPGAYSNGDNGLPLTSAALNLSWEVKSSGTDALGMSVGWEPEDELPGFDRSHAGIVWFEQGMGWVAGAGGGFNGGGGLNAGSGLNGGRFDLAVANTDRKGIFSIASAGIGETGSRVYPNPATTGFYAEVKGQCQLELFDQEGKLVQSRNASGGSFYFGLDAGLPAGVYLLKIVQEGGTVESKKILIVK